MAKDKWPFMQFYVADWIQDTQLLSLKGEGAWIRIICQMWIAPERGVLSLTPRDFTTLLRLDNDHDAEVMLHELSRVGDVYPTNRERNHADTWATIVNITITSRRMVRDEVKRKAKRDADIKYNEKRTKGKRSKNDSKTTDILHTSEDILHTSNRKKISRTKKQRTSFPDDFVVSGRILQLSKHNQWPDPVAELEAFRDYHSSRGSTFLDWEAAFRTWLRTGKRLNGNKRPQTKGDQSMDKLKKILEWGEEK